MYDYTRGTTCRHTVLNSFIFAVSPFVWRGRGWWGVGVIQRYRETASDLVCNLFIWPMISGQDNCVPEKPWTNYLFLTFADTMRLLRTGWRGLAKLDRAAAIVLLARVSGTYLVLRGEKCSLHSSGQKPGHSQPRCNVCYCIGFMGQAHYMS